MIPALPLPHYYQTTQAEPTGSPISPVPTLTLQIPQDLYNEVEDDRFSTASTVVSLPDPELDLPRRSALRSTHANSAIPGGPNARSLLDLELIAERPQRRRHYRQAHLHTDQPQANHGRLAARNPAAFTLSELLYHRAEYERVLRSRLLTAITFSDHVQSQRIQTAPLARHADEHANTIVGAQMKDLLRFLAQGHDDRVRRCDILEDAVEDVVEELGCYRSLCEACGHSPQLWCIFPWKAEFSDFGYALEMHINDVLFPR